MSWKIKRHDVPVRSLNDRIERPDPMPTPVVPKEDILAAIQVIACKDGQVYISAPDDPMQAYMLLIDGLAETRKRHAALMQQQIEAKEKLVMPFPAGVIPK